MTTLLFLLLASGSLSIGVVFWICMLLWLILGGWLYWAPPNYKPFGGHLFLWFMLFLLGWATFGFPIVG